LSHLLDSFRRIFRRPEMLTNQLGMTQINRTGMGLLFEYPNFGKIVQYRFGFYFQLAGQLVDTYLIWVSHL
jgi:hypothetical protein